MYAVLETGSHQYKAMLGSELIIERLPYPVGSQVTLDDVYLISDEDGIVVGQPTVPEAKVVATIVEEFRGPKIRIFKYKPKERYRRRMGHRQTYMRLRVDKIVTTSGEEYELEEPVAEVQVEGATAIDMPVAQVELQVEAVEEPVVEEDVLEAAPEVEPEVESEETVEGVEDNGTQEG